jgi:hypothetical protein
VFEKLQDLDVITYLKADAIMFHHVYSNLVMLAKSNVLNKNVLDMNQHYLELELFLREDPEIAMERSYEVFASERRLYGNDKKVNHRLKTSYEAVEEAIFSREDTDQLLPLLVSGVASMRKKLLSYAQNQLPGGKYWEPEQNIKDTLQSLKPNNDICKSILGLNDYLSSALPNMHQMTKSNLVQSKRTKQCSG